jgi:hypothetical protein
MKNAIRLVALYERLSHDDETYSIHQSKISTLYIIYFQTKERTSLKPKISTLHRTSKRQGEHQR